MLTLKRAFPKMTRFLICTSIIYAAFVFCGWLVLGPFHIKVWFEVLLSQSLDDLYKLCYSLILVSLHIQNGWEFIFSDKRWWHVCYIYHFRDYHWSNLVLRKNLSVFVHLFIHLRCPQSSSVGDFRRLWNDKGKNLFYVIKSIKYKQWWKK